MISYIVGLVVAGAIAFYVYQDAEKRGMSGIGWAAGTFLLCIVFLPLYFIMRKPLQSGPGGTSPMGPI